MAKDVTRGLCILQRVPYERVEKERCELKWLDRERLSSLWSVVEAFSKTSLLCTVRHKSCNV